MKSKILLLVLGLMFAFGTVAFAATDIVQYPSGYFVPDQAHTYSSPYYRWYGDDWGWTHGAIAGSFSSAALNIGAWDVDWASGEVDEVWAKDSGVWKMLGTLTGTNDAWDYGNNFVLGSNFYDDINAGLEVMIKIDVNDDGWAVTLSKSVLTTDGGYVPPPTPGGVPEPATMLLLGLGLVGIAGLRKKM